MCPGISPPLGRLHRERRIAVSPPAPPRAASAWTSSHSPPSDSELVLHKRDITKKAVQGVLDVLNRARFRRQLETIAGYDVSRAGETIV